ncbi:transmembrane protein 192 [Latimeria chalumnae]|uniref:Transmembrane protein 192 n=1 Tax=Latimeria chalumnae TaxID=7897 RepID=H3A7T8_LATCH|nr:PREDICTED: transmembrane protein 192 [Latimeria chalumnae]|eukprot:XP_006010385.1 PREDICTED: transmembrane protein 192 [Latimeria chalumnae]
MEKLDRGRQTNSSLEISQSMEDDSLLDAPLIPASALDSEIKPCFKPLPTDCYASLLLCLHVTFVILGCVLAAFCSFDEKNVPQCQPYISPLSVDSVIIFSKVILWFLIVIFERCLHFHHRKAKSRGYLLLYQSTRSLKRMPLFISSLGNAALLVGLYIPLEKGHIHLLVILGILALELVASLIVIIIYIVKIKKFNKEQPDPDVNQEEKMFTYPISRSGGNSEIGFRDGSSLEEIVEKQADLVEYLRQHNALLSKRLLALTSQQIRD